MADWVELRVHGVSGTPPDSMLASAHVRQVAGDDRSRSFRPADAQGVVSTAADGHVVEAFHWGRWTSGSWKQGLWLLLIPFGIVNAAQFMLPTPASRAARAAHALSGAVLRLLALVLTVLFAVGACVVVVDLLAWQWLARRDIRVADPLLVDVVLIIAALVVAALITFLLSRLGQTHEGAGYLHATPATGARDTGRLPGLDDASFFDGDPDSPTLRLLHRTAGLAVVAWVGLSAADQVGPGWADGRQWIGAAVLGGTAVVLAFLGDPEWTTSIAGPDDRGRLRGFWYGKHERGERRPRGASGVLAWALLACALGALGLAVVAVAGSRGGGHGLIGAESDTGLPGMDELSAATGIAGTVAVLVLLVTVGVLAVLTRHSGTRIRPFRRFAGGMAAAYAASVGFVLGIGLTAGFTITVQGVLNRFRDDVPARVHEALREAVGGAAADRVVSGVVAPVTAAPVLQRVSYAWGLTFLVILFLAVLAGIQVFLRRRATFEKRVTSAMTFGDLDGSRLSPRWVGRVARAMRIARLKNHVVLVFTIFAAAGALLSLAAVVGYERQHETLARLSSWVQEQGGPGWLADALAGLGRWVDELWSGPGFLTGMGSVPGEPVTAADVVIGGGQLFLLGLASGAVLLARGAIRAEGARRGLNVVWDVIAFWPRSVHPFVPPPYAQEVVPALVRRICWLLGERTDPFVAVRGDGAPRRLSQNPEPARHLVLAAHSQGSLISLAALMWLPPTVVPKVSWLTFGSQLRQQFPRAFPHYVRVSDLQDLQKRHRWLSLYRDTDPIAGPVTSWCHRSDDGRPRSRRLHSPDEDIDDVVDPLTGRRQCGAEWRLLDPAPDDTECQRRAVARIAGHSDYWMSPDWDDAVSWVRAPIPPAEWVTAYPPVPGPTPEPRPDPRREPAPWPVQESEAESVPESEAESVPESVDLRWTSRVWRRAPGRRSASSRS